MPYIGKSPEFGVRNHLYQATAEQTSFSGSDSDSLVLTYSDSMYMDVYQNGVLLKPGTDYAATTGTTVVLTTGASASDVVEMVVYDAFSVADSYTKSESDTLPFGQQLHHPQRSTISADITMTATRTVYRRGRLQNATALLTDIGASYDQRLNVDTIADKAGTGPVAFTKQHVSKCYAQWDMSGTAHINDSFATSSFTDVDTEWLK